MNTSTAAQLVTFEPTPELVANALRIADAAVVCDIESECAFFQEGGHRWYDTRPMLDEREHCPEVIDMARQALDYADRRGLVRRQASAPHLLRIVASL